MLITCPTCKKPYYVNREEVGRVRPVKCGACASIWVVEKEQLSDIPVLDLVAVPEPAGVGAKGFSRKLSRPALSMRVPQKRYLGIWFVLLLGGSLLTMNHMWPLLKVQGVRFLSWIYPGGDRATVQPLLRIDGLQLRTDQATGLLSVTGVIHNDSPTPQKLVPIKLNLLGVPKGLANDSSLSKKQWVICEIVTHVPSKKEVPPGGALTFVHQFSSPMPWLRSITAGF